MAISAPGAEMPDLVNTSEYKKLLADLRRIIREGKEEAERAATQALIESYWSIGQRIAREKLNERAGYHNAILADLSADLDIDLRTLQRTVTFYRTYRRPPRVEGLSWAHYRVLMQLQDPGERAFYEDLAISDAISVKRLSAAIQGNHYLSALEQPKGKALILPRPTDPSYLYTAEPRDVIDADTLLLDIDLGFEVIRRQRIRRYVREQLAVARSIVIKTVKTDLHGRYVAHIFYAFNNRGIEHTFNKGRYLNQELVNKGFAKVV